MPPSRRRGRSRAPSSASLLHSSEVPLEEQKSTSEVGHITCHLDFAFPQLNAIHSCPRQAQRRGARGTAMPGVPTATAAVVAFAAGQGWPCHHRQRQDPTRMHGEVACRGPPLDLAWPGRLQ
nr:unnamed protein product [Digitaria exilis]